MLYILYVLSEVLYIPDLSEVYTYPDAHYLLYFTLSVPTQTCANVIDTL